MSKRNTYDAEELDIPLLDKENNHEESSPAFHHHGDYQPKWQRNIRGSLQSRKLAIFNIAAMSFLVILLFSSVMVPSSQSSKSIASVAFKAAVDSMQKRVTLKDYLLNAKNYRAKGSTQEHLVLITNKIDDRFCKSVMSGLVNGYPAPHVPFINQTFEKGLFHKLDVFRQYAEKQAKDDEMLFLMDGHDVMFQLSMQTMLDRFNNSGKDIIVGADKRCWPMAENEPGCANVPKSELADDIFGEKTDRDRWGSPWNRALFINSGAIMGRTQELRRLLNIGADYLYNAAEKKQRVDDQEAIAIPLTDPALKFNWSTDTTSNMFQTMIDGEVDLVWEVNPHPLTPSTIWTEKKSSQRKLQMADMGFEADNERQTSFWRDRRLARNQRSNVIPALVHYAGTPTKKLFPQWWPMHWYGDAEIQREIFAAFDQETQPGGAGIWVRERWMTFREVCSSFDLSV